MAEETKKNGEPGRKDPAADRFAGVIARKAVEPIATAAATAGAAYLSRKSSQLWGERLAPKIRAQGGARALAESTIKKASEKVATQGPKAISTLTERGASAFSTLTERVSAVRKRHSGVTRAALQAKPKGRREEERKQRQRRRNERERALKRSGSS
jgi:hypothetical protein